MIFSVFDHHAKRFDYFEAPGTSVVFGARGTKYRALNQPPQGPLASSMGLGGRGAASGDRVNIGFAPEALAMELPANARQVGRGSDARGIIAVQDVVPRGFVSPTLNGTVWGLDGHLGEVPFGEEPTVIAKTPFAQIVTAACVAAVVGVVVQKLLK
jgi:hypothetical protein